MEQFKIWFEVEDDVQQLINKFDKEYPRAGVMVDGRKVRKEIPNMSSIGSSVNEYKILPGVRDFPIHDFGGITSFYAHDDRQRVRSLMQQIQMSNEINPVIIVEEKKGPYILEGGHRMAALVELKAKSIPALIVIDIESFLG